MPYSRLFLQRALLPLQPSPLERGYGYWESVMTSTPLGVAFAVPQNTVAQGLGRPRRRAARGEPQRARRRLDQDVDVGRTTRQTTRSDARHAARGEGDAPPYDPALPVLDPVPISVGGLQSTGKRARPPGGSSSSSSGGTQHRAGSDGGSQQHTAAWAEWPHEEEYHPTESAGRICLSILFIV